MGVHRAVPARRSIGTRAAVAAVLLVVLGGGFATPAAASNGTYLRLAHLDDQMAAGELVVSSVADPGRQIRIPGPEYGGLSEYQPIEPGSYVISVRAAGTDGPSLLSTSLDVMAGSAYTLATVGARAGERGLRVFVDDLSAPPPGQGRLRVINAAAPTVDARTAQEPIAAGLPRGEVSEYRTVPAGTTTLAVVGAGRPSTDLAVTVEPNQVVSVVLVDRDGAVAARPRIDAGGPPAVPPGPVHAGFGGAAGDRPAGGPGVVVFLMLTVGAAAVSTHLARRTARRRSG